ncbi:BLUF domain-containing protein [Sphingomonas sp. S2-65]|uniref:BLUF domain-containing protein n=1 Tax=Sphingomonas sp. S2-65 TaxID=2903960 RepID=UPI001F218E96|nr:BLUF domain-containing protein [Sphingomonas sp. S2-65]UYY57137.1 BLUF domain-containing protein [Sphingomonas sp. S2-65]
MSIDQPLCRLVYVSRSVGSVAGDDRAAILTTSRRNNGMDGVTGILWAEGDRYLQYLEGPQESVESTFERIARDPRHEQVTVIDSGEQEARIFGDWAMAGLPGDVPRDARSRLNSMLGNSPEAILALFP